jgi:hypothetical protein
MSFYHGSIIDWTSEQLVQEPSFLKKGVDIILGADIFFHPMLSPALAKCVASYLHPKGVFYGMYHSSDQYRNIILSLYFLCTSTLVYLFLIFSLKVHLPLGEL